MEDLNNKDKNEREEEQDQGITIQEFMEQNIKRDELMKEILKNNEEANKCSYEKGYINQRLFGCFTCSFKYQQDYGFCLACFLECHLNHDTFEIGIKRSFRCDCCTIKKQQIYYQQQQQLQQDDQQYSDQQQNDLTKDINQNKCYFNNNKGLNENNIYDQNFQNKFCICRINYDQKEFMINCVGCLDYFHSYHLNLNEVEQQILENDENINLMICSTCVRNKYYLFLNYQNNPKVLIDLVKQYQEIIKNEEVEEEELKRKRIKLEEKQCLIKKLYDKENILKQYNDKAIFINNNYKQEICKCFDCINIFKGLEIDLEVIDENGKFLDKDYEMEKEVLIDLEAGDEMIRQEMKKYDHVTQCNIAYKYKQFKDKVCSFISHLQNNNNQTIITLDQIQPFLDSLHQS